MTWLIIFGKKNISTAKLESVKEMEGENDMGTSMKCDYSGNASSIKSISDNLLETKKMNKLLASHTGRNVEEIDQAISYDHYFSVYEATEFGLCDGQINFSDVVDLTNGVEA